MNPRRALATGAVLLLLASLPLASPAQSATSRFWPPKGDRVSSARERPLPATAGTDALQPGTPGEPVHLQILDRGSHYEAVASNPAPGPVQVRLTLRGGEDLRALPALPAEAVLAAGASRSLARLYRRDAQAVGGFDLDLTQVPGDPRARPLD